MVSIRERDSKDLGFEHGSFTPYTWGLDKIDKILAKPNRGDLVVLVGYPGMGKTEFTFFVAHENCRKGNKIAYVTLELSKKQLLQRRARKRAGVSYQDYQNANYTPEQAERMDNYLKEYSEIENMFIVGCKETPSIEEIKGLCIECKNKGFDFVIIDNLGKIDNCATDLEAQSRVTAELQNIKNELDMCIILVHHLRKPSKGDIFKPGGGSSFSGSQKIKDNCSVMIEVWRDTDPYNNSPKEKAQVKILQYKQTWDGITGAVDIYFNKGNYLEHYYE